MTGPTCRRRSYRTLGTAFAAALIWLMVCPPGCKSGLKTGDGGPGDLDRRPPRPPKGMVFFPASELTMGSSRGAANESPRQRARVAAFFMDRTEVSFGAYAKCVKAGACPPSRYAGDPLLGRATHPVVGLTRLEAERYCAWRGKRLPTEAEWERAARGTGGRSYPWGSKPPSCKLARFRGCGKGPVATTALAAGKTPSGVLNMSGNVFEWVRGCLVPAGPVAASGCACSRPTRRLGKRSRRALGQKTSAAGGQDRSPLPSNQASESPRTDPPGTGQKDPVPPPPPDPPGRRPTDDQGRPPSPGPKGNDPPGPSPGPHHPPPGGRERGKPDPPGGPATGGNDKSGHAPQGRSLLLRVVGLMPLLLPTGCSPRPLGEEPQQDGPRGDRPVGEHPPPQDRDPSPRDAPRAQAIPDRPPPDQPWAVDRCSVALVKGGAWSYPKDYLRAASRDGLSPLARSPLVGFRCASRYQERIPGPAELGADAGPMSTEWRITRIPESGREDADR